MKINQKYEKNKLLYKIFNHKAITSIKLFIIFFNFFFSYKYIEITKLKKNNSLSYYRKYIKDCYNLKNYRRKIIKNKYSYFSICLPVYNMEKYIEKDIFSIINQSFQDFEIVIVDDFSQDNTKNILKRWYFKFKRKNYFMYGS